jgi:hypothetical protein
MPDKPGQPVRVSENAEKAIEECLKRSRETGKPNVRLVAEAHGISEFYLTKLLRLWRIGLVRKNSEAEPARVKVQPDRYLNQIRHLHRGLTEAQVELLLTRDVSKGIADTGHPAGHHRAEAMRRLFPSHGPHPWRVEMIAAVQECFDAGIKELGFLGGYNSTKSATLADLAVALWHEDPENTSIYITSPNKTASTTNIWAAIMEQFDEALGEIKPPVGRVKISENIITFMDPQLERRHPRGFIRLFCADEIGKLVGKKAKNVEKGRLILIADELSAFMDRGRALITVLGNLLSVPNFLLIGAGNLSSERDAMGVLFEPPDGWHSVDAHRDFRWISRRGGLALRFDAEQSPNVLEDRIIYPFLPTRQMLEATERTEGGKRSPGYFRWVHSLPCMGGDEFSVLSKPEMEAGGCYEEGYEMTAAKIILGAGADPGFGGDPGVLQFWRMPEIIFADGTVGRVFELWGPPLCIPVKADYNISDEEKKTINRQIAAFCKKECERRGVPEENFGFDESMRGGITKAMCEWSLKIVPVSSMGPSTTRPLSLLRHVKDAAERGEVKIRTARDEYFHFATELWFNVKTVINSGRFRGMRHSPEAAEQFCKRRWDWGGKRKQLESKASYRQDNQFHSPNEADAVAVGLEIAIRRGFALNGQPGRSLADPLTLLREQQRQAEEYRRIGQMKKTLPAGRLHGMALGSAGALRSLRPIHT